MSADLGIVSIATNNYLDYWKQMALSCKEYFSNPDLLKFYIFTDKPSELKDFSELLKPAELKIIEIASYTWPTATSIRYELFDSFRDCFNTASLLYLDSDMLVVSKLTLNEFEPKIDAMHLVQHPGYFRPKSLLGKLKLYLSHPAIFYLDLVLKTKFGALGTWESNFNSSAYVTRSSRSKYHCGGIWFGKKDTFLNFCHELATWTNEDKKLDYVAIWHDESYLNKFYSQNQCVSVSPIYCFDERFPQLSELGNPKIIAVNKNSEGNDFERV